MIVTKTIDELCHVGRGRVISNQYIKENPGSYPVYSSQTANNGNMGNISTFDFDGEYVTWTTDGANAGTVFYRNGKFNCTNICGTLKAKNANEIDMQYLALALSRHAKEYVIIASGNPKLMNNTVKRISISFPESIATQKEIVADIFRRMAAIDAMAARTTQQIADAECYIERKTQERLVESQNDSWKSGLLEDCATINPSVRDITRRPDEEELVSFVPMPAVSAEEGRITEQIVKPYSEVRKGYTYFEEGDILFAKITPCMQNGKIAIARNLENGIGFGSTEFHVIRSNDAIIPEWLYYLFRRKTYLAQAAEKMQGAVGQQRLPEEVIRNTPVAFPDSTDEQREIIGALESEIAIARKLIRDLRKQQENLSALRACIFREAFGNEE